jgi:hypothetical protein
LTVFALAAPATAGNCCDLPVRINEIRTAYPAPEPQNNEYFELVGPPDTLLNCMFYIVLGPTGVVDELIALGGASIPADGHFLVGQVNPLPFFGVSPDMVAPLNFVDGGNHTHLLVCACDGLPGVVPGTDLDVNDDGTIDLPPWDCVVDCIGLVQNPMTPVYCPVTRGPTPMGGAPPHVFRCQPINYWVVGPAPLPGSPDTPGTPNPPCAPGGPVVTAFGMPHTALGGAELLHEPGGELVISNIGSSGEDGVSIDPGRADFICLELGSLSLSELLGGSIQVSAGGQINNAPVTEIAHVALQGDASYIGVHADFPPATTNLVDVTLYSGGDVAYQTTTIDIELVALSILPWDLPDGLPPIICEFAPKIPPDDFPIFEIGITLTLPSTTTMMVGQDSVMADRIVIQPTEMFGYDAYGRLDLMVTALLSLGIAAEMIGRFGYPHAAVGNATIEGQCQPEPACDSEQLVVGNIGTDGYDGVRMSVPYYLRQPNGMIIGLIIYPDLMGAPAGTAFMETSALSDGMSDMPMPYSTFTDLGGGLTELIVGWEGPEAAAIQFELNGEVVAAQSDGESPYEFIGGFHIADLATVEYFVDGDMLCRRFCSNVVFGGPGGVQAECVVTCVPAPDPPETFDLLTVEAAAAVPQGAAAGGAWSFVITGEEPILETPDCPGDLDGDGSVGVTDFLLILAAWGPCGGCPEDLDGSGDVGIGDFLLLLAFWGACP